MNFVAPSRYPNSQPTWSDPSHRESITYQLTCHTLLPRLQSIREQAARRKRINYLPSVRVA